ncbi:MAG: amidohydrolase family protein, partial [Chloroflexi bacterium]|nr:amidohydrolase family protein [Chloroflexota bacterium]
RLIVSINRHENPVMAAQVATLACERQKNGIVGLDLAGNEAEYSAAPFIKIFNNAKKYGMHITIHAGEWNSADNIIQAIEQFGADRIGHGIRVLDSPSAVTLARQQGVAFEVCLTSNQHSGAVSSINKHPFLKMLDQGLNVTLNTDDPSISQINLSDEYTLALSELGMSYYTLRQCIMNSVHAAFISEDEKQKLIQSFEKKMPSLLKAPK